MTGSGRAYMTDSEAKQAILDVGRRMYAFKMVAANDGNISVKVAPDILWCTPTGVSKGFMKEDMLVKMDLSGKVLGGGRLKPSSEIKMHLRVYQENSEVNAVVHAHPQIATSYAIAGIPLERAFSSEAVLNLGVVPVAPYANPGTYEVPDSIAPFVKEYNAVLLSNHGALTWGKDLYEAYYRMETLEHYAGMIMYTSNIIGRQNPLSCAQIQELLVTRERMGIKSGGIPPCEANPQPIIKGEGCDRGCPAASPQQAAADDGGTELVGLITRKVLEALGR